MLGIAGRAITSMISSQGYNDVLRIYFAAERDGVDYNLAFIGRDFTVEYDKPFEQSYMRGPANSPPEAGSNRHLRPVNSPPLTAGTEPLGEAEPSLTNNPIWQA